MRVVQPSAMTVDHLDAHSVVLSGARGERLALTVLDHDLIRVQHWPDGHPRMDRTWLVVGLDGDVPREGRPRADLSPFPLPPVSVTRHDAGINVRTERLRVDLKVAEPRLRWSTADGVPFAADLRGRAYSYDLTGSSVYHYLERRSDEHYYGFGERAGSLDKTGMRFRMVNVDALGYNAETSDPLYKHIPFYITFLPDLQIAYGLFYDSTATVVFDMGKEIDAFWGYYRYYQAEAGDLDYYLIFGPGIDRVVQRYTALTGRPVLLPRWSLGYLGSTMHYTEVPNAQEMLARFVEDCDRHDIPCDLYHLSSGYSTGPDGRRFVFTWNRSKVPDSAGLAQTFHEAGIHLAANIKPHLLHDHPDYEEVASSGGFVMDASGERPATATFWSGGAFESGQGAYVDFLSDVGFTWWKRKATEQLLAYGIDVLWNDNNEFQLWDDEALCDGFGRPLPVALARPLLTLLMGRASFEALQEHDPNGRAFVLTRAACAGMQRYTQTWSGDNTTSWHTLRYNIPMGLGLSLSGMPNCGHDVGGFHGPAPDPELLVRWVQNGIFHPRFNLHSWNSDGTATVPWMYPEVLPIIRDAIRFRYRLIPYLYTLMAEAARTGAPIIRPLVYRFPTDRRCATEAFDFMLGPNLLVASVLEPGATSRRVYLPGAIDWYDFHSGARYHGGQMVEVEAPLERIPLFVPAGGMIPFGKAMRYVGELPDDVRQVYLFPLPGDSECSFTVIEDDGVSLDYRQGNYADITVRAVCESDSLVLSAERTSGQFVPAYSQIEFVLPPGERRPVTGPTVLREWEDDEHRRHVVIPLSISTDTSA